MGWATDYAWSPDGTLLAFSFGYNTFDSEVSDVYMTNTNGSRLVNLTGEEMDGFLPKWQP
jgi:Tol biopolymer transport system component